MKPAFYACKYCGTRIPSTMVENRVRFGSRRILEIPRVFCDNDDCPAHGAELLRNPPRDSVKELTDDNL